MTVLAHGQERISDVIYEKTGGVALTMDVFKPEKANGEAVIFVISGGWVSSHDSINPDVAKPFNARGITVFEVVHGSAPRYHVQEIVPMILRAVRFIRANAGVYGISPNKIGIFGGSAGGHLSLEMGAYGVPGDPQAKDPVDRESSAVQAIVAFFPPTDMLNFGEDGKFALNVPLLKIFWPAFGITSQTPETESMDLAKKLSPIYRVSSQFPPTLLIHGDKDALVPYQQSVIMDQALAKAGVDHKLIVAPGYGHDPKLIVDKLTDMLDWFDAHLKG
jgi:acetyl esterase/lipase